MQGDDSKEGKDSKRLSRAELLEMLIEQSKEVESLKKKVDELQKQLDDRTIQLQQTGSIAEAALALNDIFKAADQAASQYIESIKRMEHEKECRVSGASPEDTRCMCCDERRYTGVLQTASL